MTNNAALSHKERGGCLSTFLIFSSIGGLFLIVENAVDFLVGQDVGAPLWYKFSNITLLCINTASYLAIWRWKRWGIITALLTSTLYYIIGVLYQGFLLWSFLASVIITMIIIAIIYPKRSFFEP